MIKRILRLIVIVMIISLILFGIFLVYSSITYFNPKPELIVWNSSKPDTIPTDSSLKVLTWNIGYAGLGDNMDFFYDDGKNVRDTKDRTLQNLDSIKYFVEKHRNSNFFLIQEVDFSSHRSFGIPENEHLADMLGITSSVGINYSVSFVPIPVFNPMGAVSSGVMTFSHQTPSVSTRYQYPGEFSWPVKLFNLRRCMLVNRYPTSNGKELVLINTHNSAFDDGSLKKQEMDFLRTFALNEFQQGNYVVAGGDWNQSPPSFPLSTFGNNYKVPFFKLSNIDENFMPDNWIWAYDSSEPTNRYLNEPYAFGKTYTGILDFFLLSPNVELMECKSHNLQFKHSDHNPVLLSFKLDGNDVN